MNKPEMFLMGIWALILVPLSMLIALPEVFVIEFIVFLLVQHMNPSNVIMIVWYFCFGGTYIYLFAKIYHNLNEQQPVGEGPKDE